MTAHMTMETVIRVKQNGITTAEYTVRADRVDVVTYWLDGRIREKGEMSLEQFRKVVAYVRDGGATG